MDTTTDNAREPQCAASPGDRSEEGGRRWALVATSLGFGVVQLDVSVVNVAIRPIGADLHAGVTGLQWVVNAYTVAFAALILSAGALGDRIGARRVFVAGFGLFRRPRCVRWPPTSECSSPPGRSKASAPRCWCRAR